MANPSESTDWDTRAEILFETYKLERQDQQTSGNQSRALLGAGLAYAAAAIAILSRANAQSAAPETTVLLFAPLPLVALVALLVTGIANVQQRARYLVALETELEDYVRISTDPSARLKDPVRVPIGFRRAEAAFGRRTPTEGRGFQLRAVVALSMGVLVHAVVFLVEIGLIIYAVRLTSGTAEVCGYVAYGVLVTGQLMGLWFAMRPAAVQKTLPIGPRQ